MCCLLLPASLPLLGRSSYTALGGIDAARNGDERHIAGSDVSWVVVILAVQWIACWRCQCWTCQAAGTAGVLEGSTRGCGRMWETRKHYISDHDLDPNPEWFVIGREDCPSLLDDRRGKTDPFPRIPLGSPPRTMFAILTTSTAMLSSMMLRVLRTIAMVPRSARSRSQAPYEAISGADPSQGHIAQQPAHRRHRKPACRLSEAH